MIVPFIVGIGGTPKVQSTTEQALALALRGAENAGAQTLMFGGAYIGQLPIYLTGDSATAASEMIEAVRRADGLILASPGYHGSVSGAFKNAIDYLEATARDTRAYLDGLPVGLIVTAYGWQASGTTLAAMRAIVHALRGWPTPLGATVNTSGGVFRDGACTDAAAAAQIDLIGLQVTTFARMRAASLA
jgi:FMN reductase